MRLTERLRRASFRVTRATRPCRYAPRSGNLKVALSPLLPFTLFLLVLCSGCSSRGGTLELEPAGSDRILTQSFANAYIAQSLDGEYEIVLVDHTQYTRQNPGKPLQPQPLSPTRQVMHLHLYWRPRTDATRNPAAVNAAIDWYVLGSDATEDVVLYEGAGVVTIHGSGRQRRVTITEGTVRPREARGTMQDPVGNSRISGTFTADVNRTRVREILNEMRQTQSAAPAASR